MVLMSTAALSSRAISTLPFSFGKLLPGLGSWIKDTAHLARARLQSENGGLLLFFRFVRIVENRLPRHHVGVSQTCLQFGLAASALRPPHGAPVSCVRVGWAGYSCIN